MKIEKRQEVIETTVYIAGDGREFDSQEACERYEEGELFAWAQERLATLPQFCEEPPACDFYASYAWVRLDRPEDLVALKMAEFQPDSVAHDYEPPSYPCWVLYHVDDMGDGYISGTLEELEKDFELFCKTVSRKIGEMEPEIVRAKKLMEGDLR